MGPRLAHRGDVAVKPITADSAVGRLLLALRGAPGGLDASQLSERFASSYGLDLARRVGLVACDGDTYRITEAGRTACPFRNPLAAKPATPEKLTMPQGETKLTRQQVLAAIKATGAAGITRKALIDKFSDLVTEQAVDMHITALNRALPPVIYKPRLGLLVAIEFQAAPAQPAAPVPPGDLLRSVTHGAALEPQAPSPSVDIDGVSLTVDHHDAADLATADLAKQMAQIGDIGVAEFDLESITMPEEAYFEATPRYAVAFPSDFHGSVDSAIAAAFENYESDSLKHAVIVACTPLGRIEVRPVFIPEAA